MFIITFSLEDGQYSWTVLYLRNATSTHNCDMEIETCDSGVSTSKIISGENLARSLRILLDIYGMESQRGSQYSNKTFRMP